MVSETVSSLGVNVRNELLKSFIIGRDKVINVTILLEEIRSSM